MNLTLPRDAGGLIEERYAVFGPGGWVERVDRVVQSIAASKGMTNAHVDRIVAIVDSKLAANRG